MWLRLRQKSGDEDRKSCMVCAICKISAPTEQIGVSVATNAVTDSTLGFFQAILGYFGFAWPSLALFGLEGNIGPLYSL